MCGLIVEDQYPIGTLWRGAKPLWFSTFNGADQGADASARIEPPGAKLASTHLGQIDRGIHVAAWEVNNCIGPLLVSCGLDMLSGAPRIAGD